MSALFLEMQEQSITQEMEALDKQIIKAMGTTQNPNAEREWNTREIIYVRYHRVQF